MSDAHAGLKKAIATVFQGASWQRCRVQFMRNVLAVVPKGSQDMVASIIRTIFAQPGRKHVRAQFAEVTRMLERSHPKVALMLEDAKDDLLAFTGFPQRHWRQIWSTNSLERVNKEIKRRTDVVGGVSQPCSAPVTGWCRSRRATRRVGGRRPPLFLRVLDARNRHHGRPRRSHRRGERATRAARRLS